MKKISVAAIFILLVAIAASRADAAETPPTEGACTADITLGDGATILNEAMAPTSS